MGNEVLIDSRLLDTKNIRVAFVYPWLSSFSKNDLDILKTHFNVTEVHATKTLKGMAALIKAIFNNDVSFVWFGSFHALVTVFFSKVFRKKVIVVAGGFETTNFPEINYGMMGEPILKYIPILTFRFADIVLAVSEFTKNEVLKYTKPKNIVVLYNAFDTQKFHPEGEKEDIIITVSEINKSTIKNKGLNTFVEAAKLLPNLKFIVVGPYLDSTIDDLKSVASSNVQFTNFIPHEDVFAYYQKAKVYVQISGVESFGCALAEAMLSECVPVVTDRGALPEVVGDTGFYVPYGDPSATAEAITKALNSDGYEARERIKRLFPISMREIRLIEIVKGCCNG